MLINQTHDDIVPFTALAYARILSEHDSNKLHGTNLDLCLYVLKQDVGVGMDKFITHIKEEHYYPRVRLACLKRLYREAKNKHLCSFATIGNLYATGLGLPKDKDLALLWEKFGALTYPGPDALDYADALPLLKQHVKQAISKSPDNLYAYLDSYYKVLDAANRILNVQETESVEEVVTVFKKAKRDKIVNKYSAATVSLTVAGTPTLLFYKNSSSGVRLIEAVAKIDGKLCSILEVAATIRGIVTELASTAPNYVDTLAKLYESKIKDHVYTIDKAHQIFVVQGAITVPKDKRQQLAKYLPEAKSAKAVIALLSQDRPAPKYPIRTPKMSQEKHQILLAKYSKKVERLRKSNPRNFLRFVGTNIFGYNPHTHEIEIVPIPVIHKEQHLSSAGFYTVWTTGVTRIYYNLKELTLKKLKADVALANTAQLYKVNGVQIEPNQNVKTLGKLPRMRIKLDTKT